MKKLWVVVFSKNKKFSANFASGSDIKVEAVDYTADFENLFGWFDA